MTKFLLKSLLISITICLAINTASRGQGACSQTLIDARTEFEAGHLYGIPAILKPCLDKGFSKQERIQAYWLLTRTYLIIDDPISAENSYLELLKLDPEYIIDEDNDPIEMVYLSKKFTTTPIFTWTIGKAGVSLSKPVIINQYGVDNTFSSNEAYKYKVGFQLGGAIDLNISDQFSLCAEVLYSQKKYEYNNLLFVQDELNYIELQHWVDLPFYLKYTIEKNKFYPFVYAGYSVNLALGASANVKFINIEGAVGESTTNLPVTGPPIKLGDKREFFNTSLIFGVGARYRIGYHYLSFEVRSLMGLTNVLNIDNQYVKNGNDYSDELLFRYAKAESDFRMNSYSIMFGFVKPLYKPRKKTDRVGPFSRIFKKKNKSE